MCTAWVSQATRRSTRHWQQYQGIAENTKVLIQSTFESTYSCTLTSERLGKLDI